MFPSLHPEVAIAVSEHIAPLRFNESNTNKGTKNKHPTFLMGEFRCYNNTCPRHAWTSGKVAIVIRQYTDGSYNAEIFKQRCRACNRLGTLTRHEEAYVDRVSFRLMKWAGVEQAQPLYVLKTTPPHEKSLCEGCKRGICPDSSR
jgi:hypothetical protein